MASNSPEQNPTRPSAMKSMLARLRGMKESVTPKADHSAAEQPAVPPLMEGNTGANPADQPVPMALAVEEMEAIAPMALPVSPAPDNEVLSALPVVEEQD